MSTREKIFAAVVVTFFVCLVVWAVRTAPPDPPPPPEKIDPPTVMEYEGNTIVEEVDGVILWELTCSKMRIDSVTQLAELEGVIAKLYQHDKEKVWQLTADKGAYDQNGKMIYVEGNVVVKEDTDKQWQLTADKGIYDSNNKLIHAEGNVVVENNEGTKLTSQKLDWFDEQEMVVATGEVKIVKDDVRAFGDLAYSNNGFKHFGLMGHAKLQKGVTDDASQ